VAELNDKLRRKVLDYADELAAMAVRAPARSAKRRVNAVVKMLRQDFGFSDEQKRRLVRKCILDGASTAKDLVKETEFNRDDVHTIVRQLEFAGEIELIDMRTGSRGRPEKLIKRTKLFKEEL
jgi:hypothetical protein